VRKEGEEEGKRGRRERRGGGEERRREGGEEGRREGGKERRRGGEGRRRGGILTCFAKEQTIVSGKGPNMLRRLAMDPPKEKIKIMKKA
jgi:hypothetical protein